MQPNGDFSSCTDWISLISAVKVSVCTQLSVCASSYCLWVSSGSVLHPVVLPTPHCALLCQQDIKSPLHNVVSLLMSRGRWWSMSESQSDSISILTWGTGQAIPRPIGMAGDDGQEIFRWRVMLRKGKLQLPYTPTATDTEGLRVEAGEGKAAQPHGMMTTAQNYSSS